MNAIDTSKLHFITPPEAQGQPVTYSFATHEPEKGPACIVQRRSEAGEPDQFSVFVDPEWYEEDSTNLEFQTIPELGECVLQWEESRP